VELLDHRYNLFSPTCFWTLFRACAAYFGIPSDLQEHVDHQGDDSHTPGSYKHIPITDPLLEDIVIWIWKITNQEIMDSKVSKLLAQTL